MIQVVNSKNEKIKEVNLLEGFEVKDISLKLLHQTVVNKLASEREGNAYAKPRAEVDYSTRKLFKQKGTGRARAGSRKSPVRVGGGTVHGPLPRDYSYTLPKKLKKRALIDAANLKAGEGNIIVIDDFGLTGIKTKAMKEVLKTLGVNKSALILIGDKNEIIEKSAGNIPGVKVMNVRHPNVYDILNHEKVIIMEKDIALFREALKWN